jgi:hypothetical protein
MAAVPTATSYIIYNTIFLDIVHAEYEKHVVLDPSGIDYLWTQVTMTAKLLYNPEGNSARVNDATGVVTQIQGRSAPQTEVALRTVLMMQRKRLRVIEGGVVTFDILDAGETCDVDNGPKPFHCEPKAKHGTRTWEVEWKVHFALREDFLAGDPHRSAKTLISNRWSVSHHMEGQAGQFREVLTRKGTAIFHPNLLLEISRVPDEFRKWILGTLRPPTGHNRGTVDILVEPDGRTLHYTVTEVRTRHRLGVSGITKVSCIHKEGIKVPNALEGLLSSISSVGNYLLNVGQAATGTGSFASLNPIPTATAVIESTTPIRHYMVHVTVYGDLSSNIETLSLWAPRAVNYRMSLSGVTTVFGNIDEERFNWESEETIDVENAIVSVVAMAISGIGERATNSLTNLQAPTDNIIMAGLADYSGGRAVAGAGMPYYENGMRGSGLGVAVSQLFQEAFQAPASPSERENPRDTDDPHR